MDETGPGELTGGTTSPGEADDRDAVPRRRGPGRPRAQPLAEQRRSVLDAACRVFARHGYDGSTVERVAREAGMPRPTVYELFGGKDELFIAVVDDAAEHVVERLSGGLERSAGLRLRDFVRQSFVTVFDLFEQDRDRVTVLLNAERGELQPPVRAVARSRRRMLQSLATYVRQRWEDGGYEIGDAGDMLATMFFRMGEAVAVRQADEGDWDREALIDLLTDFSLGGIERLAVDAPGVLEAAGRRVPPGSAPAG